MKKLLITVLSILTLTICAVGLTACSNIPKNSNAITFNTLTVDGTNVYGKVENGTKTFSFINEIVATGSATYILSSDIYGEKVIPTKTVALETGDNTFYVLAENTDEGLILYTVVIRVKPLYKIEFDTLGGSKISSQFIQEDEFVSIPNEPIKAGYTFNGWDFDFLNTPITFNRTISVKEWTPNQYTLSFEGIGTENLPNTQITCGEYYDLPSISSRDGYYFEGFFTKIEGGERIFNTTKIQTSEDVVLYARWRLLYYKLSFSVNSNYSINVKVNNNDCVLLPDTSQNNTYFTNVSINDIIELSLTAKTGYIPISIEMTGSNYNYTNNLLSKVKEDITISGNVSPISYKISFNQNGSNVSGEMPEQEFIYNITENLLSNTYKKLGYTFVGWEYNEKIYSDCASIVNLTTINNDNITFNAQWKTDVVYVATGNEYSVSGINTHKSDIVILSEYEGKKVTKINNSAFSGCTQLKSVFIPNSVNSIGNGAFNYCENLQSVTLPEHFALGDYAFKHCDKLKTIYYWGASNFWSHIQINSTNESIYYNYSLSIFYYLETNPTISGKYWHYSDGEVVVWE